MMVHTAETLRDTLRENWDLDGKVHVTSIKFRVTKQNPKTRFSGKNISIEIITMTAPNRKRSKGPGVIRRLLTVDIWYSAKPFTEDKMEEYNDHMKEMIDEVSDIFYDNQDSMDGIKLAYIQNQEVNLDEIDNQILHRQMMVLCIEEENVS